MRQLTIYRRYFYDADCYTQGKPQKNIGVQVHSTGSNNSYLKRYVQPDDGRLGMNKYNNHHNRKGLTTCASAYIGKQDDGTVAVYQTIPFEYRSWLSGSAAKGNANRLGYVGFEICEDSLTNKAYFDDAVMEKSVLLSAHLCTVFGADESMVFDHKELHAKGLASNHADITHWLKKFGYTMNDYRERVRSALAEGVQVTYINCDGEVTVLYDAKVTTPGTWLNLRDGKSGNAKVLAQMPRGSTVQVLNDTGVWWQVAFSGINGFAMSSENGKTYLEPLKTPPVTVPAPSPLKDINDKLETARVAISDALSMLGGMKG